MMSKSEVTWLERYRKGLKRTEWWCDSSVGKVGWEKKRELQGRESMAEQESGSARRAGVN
jgi:hypothetical protein